MVCMQITGIHTLYQKLSQPSGTISIIVGHATWQVTTMMLSRLVNIARVTAMEEGMRKSIFVWSIEACT